jgi:hypothetical protein
VQAADSAARRVGGIRIFAQPGVAAMMYYRLYFLDRFSGHIDHYREFEAETDEAALAISFGWREDRPMELWNLQRKLKHWDEEPLADG